MRVRDVHVAVFLHSYRLPVSSEVLHEDVTIAHEISVGHSLGVDGLVILLVAWVGHEASRSKGVGKAATVGVVELPCVRCAAVRIRVGNLADAQPPPMVIG